MAMDRNTHPLRCQWFSCRYTHLIFFFSSVVLFSGALRIVVSLSRSHGDM
jgi:hypothetical protein